MIWTTCKVRKAELQNTNNVLYIHRYYRAFENGLIGGYTRQGFPDSVDDDCVDVEDNSVEDRLGLRGKGKVLIGFDWKSFGTWK